MEIHSNSPKLYYGFKDFELHITLAMYIQLLLGTVIGSQ